MATEVKDAGRLSLKIWNAAIVLPDRREQLIGLCDRLADEYRDPSDLLTAAEKMLTTYIVDIYVSCATVIRNMG